MKLEIDLTADQITEAVAQKKNDFNFIYDIADNSLNQEAKYELLFKLCYDLNDSQLEYVLEHVYGIKEDRLNEDE